MSALRYYKISECDEQGVPLDWEKCRMCVVRAANLGPEWNDEECCPVCDGHGSLKAAALAMAVSRQRDDGMPRRFHEQHDYDVAHANDPVRCEDCGHPMSDGVWDGPSAEIPATSTEFAHGIPDYFWMNVARDGFTFDPYVHYSPCDEGCRHGGHVRIFAEHEGQLDRETELVEGGAAKILHRKPEASWRPVGIRTLDRPCMLEPEYLAILCLRCFAERKRSS